MANPGASNLRFRRIRRTITADGTYSVGMGAPYGALHRVDVLSSADTSVAVTVNDDDGVARATFASGDYTTIARRFIVPVETTVFDSGGDPAIDAEGVSPPVVCKGPLDIVVTGLGSGNVRVDLFVEV